MNPLPRALATAQDVLAAAGRRFAVVGGLAVSARTEPRFTRDVDLAVFVASDGEAEELARVFVARGFRILASVEQDTAARLAMLRLAAPPDAGVVVNLLFAFSGIEPEIVQAAEIIELFAGVPVPVARLEHLIALKVLARNDRTRPQDRLDLFALLRAAPESERSAAGEALALISKRGFARGLDLSQRLAEAVVEAGEA